MDIGLFTAAENPLGKDTGLLGVGRLPGSEMGLLGVGRLPGGMSEGVLE
ncbi:MAG: hypothetical protein II767_01205 [Proteobacteria bacterium]|nr:hypothetical protein [Pseudomonadota bacterium]